MSSTRPEYPPGEELEERIFDGFPSAEDQRLCEEFHRVDWPEKIEVAAKFIDKRFRLLAQRLLYISHTPVLNPIETKKIEDAIAARIWGDGRERKAWRTHADAMAEIPKLYTDPRFLPIDVARIEKWLEHYPAQTKDQM